MKLRRSARHAIEFLDGQFQRPIFLRTAAEQRSEPANLQDRLHGAFAEGVLVTDDEGPSVILQGRGKNLTRGRALPARQHNERTAVGNARIWIARDDDVSVRTFRLDDRSRLQKEP